MIVLSCDLCAPQGRSRGYQETGHLDHIRDVVDSAESPPVCRVGLSTPPFVDALDRPGLRLPLCLSPPLQVLIAHLTGCTGRTLRHSHTSMTLSPSERHELDG